MDTLIGRMGWSCISMALSDFYASHGYYNTRLVLHTRDSKDDDVVGAAAAVLDLLKNVQVEAIIGPATSMQANFVVNLGEKAQVPIISFSATSPSVSSINRSPYFIRATHNDSSQVKAISAIIQTYGWREAVPIYADNEFGEGIIPFLIDALQEIDTRIPYRSVISPLATDDQISTELHKLMTMQTRVFIVHMLPSLGSKLFTKAKEVGMMSEGYVWIITDGLTDLLSSLDFSTIDSMQGVLGIKTHVPRTKQLEDFKIRWKSTFQQDNPTEINAELNIFGSWAYDAATALAMAVEKLGVTSMGFQRTNISGNSRDLESFGISQNGPKLLQALKSTTFRGLCGDFRIIDGQLQSSVYQIVNVIGKGERGIGFWTAKNGIVRELKSTNTTTYSTSSANLGIIIWPGDTTSPPNGWVVIPSKRKILRVGVPVKDGFSEFVKMTRNPDINNTQKVAGYSIDVFDAVMAALPYPVPYEYIPFATPEGRSAGTYNDLVYQVFLGNFDAVVGDTTILANRSRYVDWTLPYTESGVSMIAPIKDNKSKNAWVFLKPLTWHLWVTCFCSFVFIGFAIWVLEHRINEDFRGPPSHQVGTIFWFPFSTLVFAHRERVVSNMARFVVIIWVFVVFILTQSYTASLTSMLTVQQLQPTVTDVNELISKGEYVGYQDGSFVLGLLKRMNFDESKLKVYNSPEECDELLSKGSRNGGIAAAFEEIPYIKLFLGRYCSKYTMVQPIYKTDGFGFAFPKGSRLVPDVSRALLHATEGDAIENFEKTWFRNQSCPDPSSLGSSSSLGVGSFWGLFLIAGVASFLALIIYTAFFLKEHRHVLSSFDPKASIWRKFVVMALHFDQKDLSSHTFKKSELRDRSVADNMNSMHTVEPCQNNNFPPPSPSSFPNHSDANFFGDQQATPSLPEYGNSNPNGQTPLEMVSAIELSNPNQDRLSA